MAIKLNLTDIIRDICDLYYPKAVERNVDIMVHRFGLEHQVARTLEEIGQKHHLTRERVRQVEESILEILTSLIKYGRYVKRYKLREKTIYLDEIDKLNISSLVSIILENNIDFLKNKDCFYSYDKGELNLVLECLGYKINTLKYSTIELKPGWFKSEKFTLFEKYLNFLHDVLKDRNRIQYFDFLIRANQGIDEFDEELFLSLLHTCVNNVSIVPINKIEYLELDFNKLSTIDKIERLLILEPVLSINDIFRKINKGSDKAVTLENIRNQMVADSRFSPIGKSGQWQLAKNEIYRNVSIVDSIKRVLMTSGEALSINDIFDKVTDIRGNTFKLKSIKTYLHTQKEDFILLDDGRYALSLWESKKSSFSKKKRVSKKSLAGFTDLLSEFMVLDEEKPLSEIVAYFVNHGYIDVSIRARLAKLITNGCFIDVTPFGKRNKTLKLVDLNFESKKEKLISEKVHEFIIQELNKIPNEIITKGELYFKIKKHMPDLNRASFYSYCSSLTHKNISTIKKDNKVYLLLES